MMFMVLLVLVGVAVVLALWLVGQYNGLVQLRNQVQNAWAQIDVQLKRRHDLIPNLVTTVKGEMKFEQDTLEKVIERPRPRARRRVDEGARRREAELSQAPRRLLAVMENYPELKANQNVAAAAGGGHLDGEQGRLRAAVLQRRRDAVQHGAADVPRQPDRADVRLPAVRVPRRCPRRTRPCRPSTCPLS